MHNSFNDNDNVNDNFLADCYLRKEIGIMRIMYSCLITAYCKLAEIMTSGLVPDGNK